MDAALQRLVSGDGMTREDLALFQLILNDGGSESGAALALAPGQGRLLLAAGDA